MGKFEVGYIHIYIYNGIYFQRMPKFTLRGACLKKHVYLAETQSLEGQGHGLQTFAQHHWGLLSTEGSAKLANFQPMC